MKKLIALLLLTALVLGGCAASPAAPIPNAAGVSVNLMANITAKPVADASDTGSLSKAATDFSVALLKNAAESGKTVVLSPYSVMQALGMTANGAKGETLQQLELALGMPIAELNKAFAAVQPDSAFRNANALWFRDDGSLEVSSDFLQACADYYGADAYAAPFDESTRTDINQWVSDHTDQRIPEMLKELRSNAALYLVNALCFDGKWVEPYSEDAIWDGVFYTADGSEQNARMMSSEEALYLKDDSATGFLKPYAGGRYSLAAILPNGSLDDYVQKLDGDALRALIDGASDDPVQAVLPQLELKSDCELADALRALGINDLFDDSADLSGIDGKQDLSVGRVLHSAVLRVDENGTEAAASTVEEIEMMGLRETNSVVLDHPFLLVIWDNQTQLSVFLAAVNSVR